MKRFLVTAISAILFTTISFAGEKANTTVLKGKVVEQVNGVEKPIPFACVYCEGTTVSAYTDENGEFSLPVDKAGKYTLRFSHAGYALVQKDVKIKKKSAKESVQLNKQEVLLTAL